MHRMMGCVRDMNRPSKDTVMEVFFDVWKRDAESGKRKHAYGNAEK